MARPFQTAAFLMAAFVIALVLEIYVLPGIPFAPRSIPDLKYGVIDAVGEPLVCGGPLAISVPPTDAYRTVTSDLPTFFAILRRTHMVPIALSDADIQRMYREWSKLDAIRLERHGAGYTFDMARGPRFGFVEVMGNVDQLGRVSGVHQGTNFESCPICLVASAQVATPDGPVAASSIQVGEHVWTAGLDGRRLDAVVVRIGTNLAPPGSRLIHLVLLDGRELTASPAHQVEDGRALSSLKVGDPLAGGVITRLELVPEPFDRTYDLLPSGPTGEYWVDGILLRSTLSASSG